MVYTAGLPLSLVQLFTMNSSRCAVIGASLRSPTLTWCAAVLSFYVQCMLQYIMYVFVCIFVYSHHTMQVAMHTRMCLRTSVIHYINGIRNTPPVQVAGDDHLEYKSSIYASW